MKKYYFTLGHSGGPFEGGWITVIADSRQEALSFYNSRYPKGSYCDIYEQEEFRKTEMYKEGNFGNYCHELIGVLRR